MDSTDGFTQVMGRRLYWKSFGEPKKGTVLCLHGGPGGTHDLLLPISDLAARGYRVVFYDQLGCGKSEVPKNPALFTMEKYAAEVEGLRRGLKLGRVNLLGHSCGGQLAIAYALKYQSGLRSLLVVSGLHNVPLVIAEMERLKNELPKEVLDVMLSHEERGEYEDPEYLKAVDVFYRRHFCRLDEWPKEVRYSLEHLSKPVYYTMNGPNEFTITGNIRYWDATEQLGTVRVPTLVTCGRYDEVTPRVAKSIHRGIRRSKLVIFPKSSHTAMWEEREKFIGVLGAFLDSVSTRRT